MVPTPDHKMALSCTKCNEPITNKHYLICFVCNNSYHQRSCSNVSTPRFHLMEPEKKISWKCNQCIQSNNARELSYQLSLDAEYNNITHRKNDKANVPTKNSFDSLSVDDDSDQSNTSIYLNRSCPEPKLHVEENLKSMKKLITELKEKLQSADQEIENLLLENSQLKTQINSYELKVCKLKSICNSTPKKSNNSAIHTKKSLSRTRLNFTRDIERHSVLSTPKVNKSTSKSAPLPPPPPKQPIQANASSDARDNPSYSTESSSTLPPKTKLCIISNGTIYNTLNMAMQKFPQAQICHYSSTGGGLHQLLYGIENKLQNFTLKDHCLICIGENDFVTSVNYRRKIDYIREKLQNLQHTNIIIVLPTYNCNSYANIFNRRIEHFNSLLYLDNLEKEYAYILDSNKNLEYNFKMFNRKNGCINKRASMVIFEDIKNFVTDINSSNYYDCTNKDLNIQNHQTFFRY